MSKVYCSVMTAVTTEERKGGGGGAKKINKSGKVPQTNGVQANSRGVSRSFDAFVVSRRNEGEDTASAVASDITHKLKHPEAVCLNRRELGD